MRMNTGNVERAFRVLVGLAILSALFWVEGDWRWMGLVGIVPVFTGLSGWCALYALLGIRTRKADAGTMGHA